jgi:type IV pilus assembly protein PilF
MTRFSSRFLLFAVFAAVLAGCASKPPATPAAPEPPPPVKQAEVSPQYRAQLHTDLGAGYYERGQMEIALAELNEALTLDPNNAKTHNIMGLVYTVLRDEPKAEQSFQRALALAPQDSDVRANWGWYLCTHGRARESIAELEQAIRNPLYRTPEIALINAAACSASLGDTRNAETYYRRALSVSVNNPAAAYGLAQLKYREARLEEARAFMKIVMLQTGPAPEALYLGLCIERKLGDRASETAYAAQLRNRYPDSPEAKVVASTGPVCE